MLSKKDAGYFHLILRGNNLKSRDYSFVFVIANAAAAKSNQSCPTQCDPIDGSPPGSSVPGILQGRTLEWVAIAFCSAWKWKVQMKFLSRASCHWMQKKQILI